jgi:uncharacterized protein (DUF1800 family)
MASEREAIARLYRRAAFGLAPGELDDLESLGVDTVVDRLVAPERSGVPPEPDDLWSDLVFPLLDSQLGARTAVSRWLDHLLTTGRPFEEWMAWYWHGHLVSSTASVPFTRMMTDQIGLFRRQGLGDFRELLRSVTVDAAMLTYLDGGESTGTNPNENYAREMLELFALGLGEFFEEDVAAGARALTGWQVHLERIEGPEELAVSVRFDPSAHDDTPQRYLGTDGIHDLEAVVDTVVTHEACAPFVASRFARAVLGPDADPGLLDDLGRTFRDNDLDLRVLARGVLEAVVEGRVADLVLGPTPWLLAAQRATQATLPADQRYWSLYDAGHVPFWPPNVGGWPGGTTWLASSTTAQRYNLAGAVASAAPEGNPALVAAIEGDLDTLADALGRPEGFTPSTRDALAGLGDGTGVGTLAVALASPDLVMA